MFSRSWMLLTTALVVGCAGRHEPSAATGKEVRITNDDDDDTPGPAAEQRIVVYATYAPIRGTINEEPSLADDVIDSFHVEKIVHGRFPTAEIRIQRHGVLNADYPKDLEDGRKYLLEIRATDHLRKELSRYEDDTIDWLSLAPEEVAVAAE